MIDPDNQVMLTLADVLKDASESQDIPGAIMTHVMGFSELSHEHVAQLHRLAEHMDLCIRARDAWRGQ